MLMELRIQNFAIIDALRLEFGPGLNILTGETGAGKSIIIDAVGLLLGDRAAAEWVRTGADLASIEAAFVLPADAERAAAIQTLLEAEGLEDTDSPQWVMLSREVRLNGRNVCRINGRSVSLQMLSGHRRAAGRCTRAGRAPGAAAAQDARSPAGSLRRAAALRPKSPSAWRKCGASAASCSGCARTRA